MVTRTWRPPLDECGSDSPSAGGSSTRGPKRRRRGAIAVQVLLCLCPVLTSSLLSCSRTPEGPSDELPDFAMATFGDGSVDQSSDEQQNLDGGSGIADLPAWDLTGFFPCLPRAANYCCVTTDDCRRQIPGRPTVCYLGVCVAPADAGFP
jgi:hypothetical protein